MSPELRQLFSQHAGSGFIKQLNFADLLGNRNWGVDLQKGTATFGDDLEFPLQLLGSEADNVQSWLWAWANEASNFPPGLLGSCENLRALGEQANIPELKEQVFKTEVADGHTLSLIASGLHSDSCYYRGPYGSGESAGALFFLLNNLPPAVTEQSPPERILTAVNQVISMFDVDHRSMIKGLLASQHYQITETDNQISSDSNRGHLAFTFNETGQLVNTTGNLNPAQTETT